MRKVRNAGLTLLILVFLTASPAMGQGPARPDDTRPLWIAVVAPGLAKAIEPLAQRRAGQGFEIQILDDTTLRTHPQRVARDVRPIRDAIAKRIGRPARPACVVLVGFEPGDPMNAQPGAKLSPFALPGGRGSADNMAGRPSDAVIGDLNDDGRPDVSIGRLPARDATQLAGMIAKIVRFESQAAPADWQHRFVLLGGSPRFGLLLDRLIETMVAAAMDRLDGRWQGTVFYDDPGSAFSLPEDRLDTAALAAMQRGAAVTVYMGHSSAEGFYLSRSQLATVKIARGAGPLVALSCSGAVQSWTGDGFAVAAMRNPDGPVAAFAAAAVSYPQWNKLLAEGLEARLFSGERPARLGELIDGMRAHLATQRLDAITLAALNWADGSDRDYDAQRRGHLEMYSLLGDPATLLPGASSPPIAMTLAAPAKASPGQTVRLSGRLGDDRLDGATVRVLVRRPASMPPPPSGPETPAQRYDRVHRLELLRSEATVRGHEFFAELALPGDWPMGMPLVVRAWASNDREQAIGSCRIEWQTK